MDKVRLYALQNQYIRTRRRSIFRKLPKDIQEHYVSLGLVPKGRYEDERSPIVEWLDQYPFGAFVTLSLEDDTISEHCLNNQILRLFRRVQKEEAIQIAFMGVVTRHRGHSRRHVHLLVCGINRRGKTIRECSIDTFSKNWKSRSDVVFITSDEDRENIIDYFVYKNMGFSYEILTPYNTRLLKKLRTQ